MIRFEDVHVTLGGRPVLRGVTRDLPERRVAVLGPNGSGKSTLARLLNGLAAPSRGRVLVDGLDPQADLAAVRRHVGFVFQNPDNQIVFPIVEEDVAFGLRNRGVPAAEALRRARDVLGAHGVAHLGDRSADTLSGGEKQLVALVGVLVTEPAVVVLDEPTTLLDLRNRNRVERTIAALPQQVVLVSHDLDLAAGCDRALVLDEGRVVADDTAGDALAWYRRHLA